uniref:rho GTPase-activating protein 24-like n=1 Tax=Euleptes europaea TaxID=460621 RepID=UPI00253FEAF5|nr:rho GTPase-activating protein 24-like [Euleptes europaea]
MNNVGEISRKSGLDNSKLEENPAPRLCIMPDCVEECEEIKKAASNIVGVHVGLEQSQTSSCSEAPLSSKDTSTSSLQCHFARLKQQMARQKAEYEAKLTSLEQRNKELQLEIKDLHSKLGQQRKWYHLVEIKIRSAERAREDAERRNATLQREMEQFFDTFGELTNELKAPERNAQSF